MSELKNGPYIAKIVDVESLDNNVIDPLLYTSGRELGKFSDDVDLISLDDAGEVLGMPSHVTLSGEDLRNTKKLNYKSLDTNTGFYSLQTIDSSDSKYRGRKIEKDTVIIGRMRPYLNNITAIDSELLEGTHIVSDSEWQVFKPHDGLIHYWTLVLRTKHILRQFSTTRGQTRPRLHEEDLRKVSVPKISEEEKKVIDERRRDLFQMLQSTETKITETSRMMETYLDKDGTLPEF